MSKKRLVNDKKISVKPQQVEQPRLPRGLTMDAFANALARLGAGMPNLLEGTDYPLTRLTKNYQLMNSLYRSHWIIRRIIDVVPEDMCKAWYEINSQLPPEWLDRFKRMERRTQVKARVLEGLKWGRLYGGAAGIIMIDGHEDILDQPLNTDMVMPGSFRGLLIVDRWSGISPGTELVTDISDPDFGLPEMYQVTSEALRSVIQVHHSRLIRFTGRDLPFWERQAETYWGASEVEHVFDELKKRDNTSWNIANLVFVANLRVLKMGELGQSLAVANGKVQEDLYNTIQAQNWLMNNMGMYVLDKDDDFDTKQYTFSGLSDVYENFMMDVAGAAEIPVTKLFGRSPAGLNATGESDLQNYYDSIEEKQESQLRPVIDKLLPIMCMSELGYVPDDLDYKFNPVRRPSDMEKADLTGKRTTAILDAFNAGVISQKIALKELQQMEETTGMWSNITDEDIARADTSFSMAGEGLSPNLTGLLNFNQQLSQNTVDSGDFNESDHPRDKTGKFTGAGGGESTGSSPSSKINSLGSNKFNKGFSEKNLNIHFDRHKKEYPHLTKEQYSQRALDLIQMPVGGNILGYVTEEGRIVRYDKNTNDFVSGDPEIGIATMMKLKGQKRFEYLKKRDEKKD